MFSSTKRGVLMRSKCSHCVQIWQEQLQILRYGLATGRWQCGACCCMKLQRTDPLGPCPVPGHGNIMPAIGARDGRGSITSNNSDLLPLFGAKSGLMGLIRAGCPIRVRGGTGSRARARPQKRAYADTLSRPNAMIIVISIYNACFARCCHYQPCWQPLMLKLDHHNLVSADT